MAWVCVTRRGFETLSKRNLGAHLVCGECPNTVQGGSAWSMRPGATRVGREVGGPWGSSWALHPRARDDGGRCHAAFPGGGTLPLLPTFRHFQAKQWKQKNSGPLPPLCRPKRLYVDTGTPAQCGWGQRSRLRCDVQGLSSQGLPCILPRTSC